VGQQIEVDGARLVGLDEALVEPGEVAVPQVALVLIDPLLVTQQLLGEGLVPGRERGLGDHRVLGDFLEEVIELFGPLGRERRAEPDFLERQVADVLVDDVADGLQLGQVSELPHLLVGVVLAGFLPGQPGQEPLDLGVEQIDLVVAHADLAGQLLVVRLHGGPDVVQHAAGDLGDVRDLA
jgi:hypothetical protein